LAAYTGLSVAIFGRQALPDLHHVVEGFGQAPAFYGRDQSFYVWSLAWAARSLTHAQNPFLTHEVFAPFGYNLAWSSSTLGPGLLVAPVTLLLGAVASFDLLAFAAPAVAAWTAFLLCHQVTGRRAPAFAGGLLFGFGAYESVEMVNHLSLALTALLPLAVLLVLRRHARLTSRWRFIAALAAVLALQLWTATEVFASLILFGAGAFVLAALLGDQGDRQRLQVTVLDTLAALAAALVLAAPYLYYALGYPNPVSGISGADAGADLANLVIPTRVTWLHGSPVQLRGNLTEQLAYLGLPLLLLLGAFAIEFRRDRLGRFLLVFTALAVVASLGAHAYVGGHNTGVPLPWDLAAQLPLLRFASPGRFAVYVWLAIALAVACWLARPSRPLLRWVTLALVGATLVPNFTGVRWGTRVDSPALMTNPALERYVPVGVTVLALPFGIAGNSMFWQMEADFRFRLAGGYVSVSLPTAYRIRRRFILGLEDGTVAAHAGSALCDFVEVTRSRAILLRDGTPGSWPRLLDPLHIRPHHLGGFLIYDLAGGSRIASRCSRLLAVRKARKVGAKRPAESRKLGK
jgi:hypothetical protein